MNYRRVGNAISPEDVAALTKDTNHHGMEKIELTRIERDDQAVPQPLVKIVNYKTGDVTQASLAQLNQQMRDFSRVILLIEDQSAFSDACTKALHGLGYDGVQLITHLLQAENHLDDIISHLTEAPAAIVLDLDWAPIAALPCCGNVMPSQDCSRSLFWFGQSTLTISRKPSATILEPRIFW